MLRKFASSPSKLSVFIVRGCSILSNAFPASIKMITWFFPLCSINMVYYTDLFSYIERLLHQWHKPHLVTVYNPFNMLLDSVCLYFCEVGYNSALAFTFCCVGPKDR